MVGVRGVSGSRHRSLFPAAAVLFALAAVLPLLSWRHGSAEAAVPAAAAQEKLADVILGLAGMLYQAAVSLLPGVVIASGAGLLYTKWDTMTRKQWAGAGVGAFALLVLWAYSVRLNAGHGTTAAPANAPNLVAQGGDEKAQFVGEVHSGEEVMLADGTWTRLPDPTRKDPAPRPGWQKGLSKALTEAISMGQEQVLIIFSRQGCPWCEKQVPVVRRAIARRATGTDLEEEDSELENSTEAPVAFVGASASLPPVPRGTNMLFAPLRVFVLDAGEFPGLAESFKVEAFPTSVFFGAPGVAPVMARGYLDDATLDEVLKAMATRAPEVESQGGGGRKPRRRRRLFR